MTIFTATTGTDNFTTNNNGDDTFNFAAGTAQSTDVIDGRAGNDTLTFTGTSGSIDFSVISISNIENLTAVGKNNNQTITVSAAQFAGFTSINMAGNNDSDVLNVTINGTVDISGGTTPSISNTETVRLADASSGSDSIKLTGAQLNLFTSIAFTGGGSDTINLTSTSTGLNALSDSNLTGVETISASTAAAAVTINLANQTEGFTVNASDKADTITGGAGNDTIIGGAGDDTITGGAGSDLLTGGLGADTFVMSAASDFTASETINGTAEQSTLDTLRLDAAGAYSLTSTVTNIDVITLNRNASGFNLTVTDSQAGSADANQDGTLNDLLIKSSASMTNGVTINASGLTGTNHITVDGTNLGGNDSITGGAGNDVLAGGSGNDTITGGAGDDTITGGAGSDLLTGGLGADTFVMSAASDFTASETINGTAEQSTLDTLRLDAAGAYSLTSTVTNIDVITLNRNASGFNLTVTDSQAGSADANQDGTLNDLLIKSSASMTNGVTINASGLTGTNHITVDGTNLGGNDSITGGAGNDVLAGGSGNDTITGGAGSDLLTGGLGADTFVMSAASDFTASETINGTAEQSTLDTLRLDAAGAYSLTSTVTNIDVITLNRNASGFNLTVTDSQAGSADANQDGTLNDLLIKSSASMTNGVTINASGLTGTNHITVDGTNLGGNDSITGGAGNDVLAGGSGNDTITGGAGDDTITGGAGSDLLTGGLGADTFVMSAASDFTASETINGTAEQSTLDTLRLDAAGAYSLTSTVTNIDVITLNRNASGFNLTVTDSQAGSADANQDGTLNDLLIKSSASMTNGVTINASGLTGTNHITVDGTNLGGNDAITGGAGNDTIDGGIGTDTVVYSGAWVDYTVSGTGPFTLTDDRVNSPDGTDTVSNVENFQFSNVTATAAQLLNDAPTNIALSTSTVAENSANGTIIGSLSDTDPDSVLGDTARYTLTNDAGGRFAISGTNLVVANGSLLDYESATSHNVTVRVADAHGATFSKTFTIAVSDQNDTAPVFTTTATFSVAENTTAVGTVTATDADTVGGPVTFAISGRADAALFSIDANSGALSFKAPRDYETQAHSYALQVTASDGTNTASQDITVNLTDVNDTAPVIEANGSTYLTQVGDRFFLDDSTGSGPSLKYAGADVVAGQFGQIAPIGAEQTASGYEVAWKLPGADQYSVWVTDNNGNYLSNTLTSVSGTSAALQSIETSFHQDLNGDGTIGPPAPPPPPAPTVIEGFGSTSLTEIDTHFYLYGSGGTGPSLKYQGADVVAGQFGQIAPIGAEQTASGYEVAWKLPGADQYSVWVTDNNGNYLSNTLTSVSGASAALQSIETSFHQDLNGDGTIGPPAPPPPPAPTVIEGFGSTSLTEIDTHFYLYGSGGTGPSLKYQGADVVAGQFGQIAPIGAEQTASGYEVAWKLPGADQYSVWVTDNNGNYLSNTLTSVSGTSAALQSIETSFHQDLNGDGTIGGQVSSPHFVYQGTDANGVRLYDVTWDTLGRHPFAVRVLAPEHPSTDYAHSFLYALPVEGGLAQSTWGSGLDELRQLGVENQYNATIIEPIFPIDPWYADSALDPTIDFETFTATLLPAWVNSNFATSSTEDDFLIGFSKSGYGALDLLFKHPAVFDAAAAWDFPADMADYNAFNAGTNYGTQANFQNNYQLTTSFIEAWKAPFTTENRIVISGYSVFETEVADFDALLTSQGVLHTLTTQVYDPHSWTGGWLSDAVAGLYGLFNPATPVTGVNSLLPSDFHIV